MLRKLKILTKKISNQLSKCEIAAVFIQLKIVETVFIGIF